MKASNIFAEMGSYWEEIARNHNTEQQIRFLKNQLKKKHYILDLACGTGRHTIPLRKEGYMIVGLDVSVNLLRIGKQRDGNAVLVCGDMRFLPFKAATFSKAISMDTSLGYSSPTENGDLESIAEAKRVLVREGSFIIDVFNRSSLAAKYQRKVPTIKNIEYQSFHLQQKRQLSGDGKLVCDTWTIRDKPDGETRVFKHTVRLYDYKQLASFLDSSGFAVKSVFGDYGEQDFSADSSRLIIVAVAK